MPGSIPIRRLLIGAVVLLMAAPFVRAAGSVEELVIYRQDGWVRVRLRAAELMDKRTASTVESGLPGTCVYYLRLEDQDHSLVAERILELSLQLNLWENLYFLSGPGEPVSYSTIEEADSAWSHLDAIDLHPVAAFNRELSYRIELSIAVQPLAPEVRERLSKYVSSNSNRSREEVAVDLGALVGRILGGGGSVGGQVHFTSDLFRLSDLEERP